MSEYADDLRELATRFVHDRDALDETELERLVAAAEADSGFAAELRDQLVVDELIRQQLDDDRGEFTAQVDQRLRDELSGMQGALSGLADLLPVRPGLDESDEGADDELVEVAADDAGRDDGDSIDLRAHAVRELAQWQRAERRARTRHLVAGLSAVLLLGIGLTAWLLLSQPIVGELRPSGEVTITRDGWTSNPTSPVDLQPGDEIVLGSEATALLVFSDETQVEFSAGTRFVVPTSAAGKLVQLEVGDLRAVVAPQPSGRPMVFDTPSAKATVVGTELSLDVREDGTTRLEVSSGRVELSRKTDGARVMVGAREFALATEDASGTLAARQETFPRLEWERRAADDVGLDADGVKRVADLLGGRGCLVRRGFLVESWGDVARRGDGSRLSEVWLTHLLLLSVEKGELEELDERVVIRAPLLADLDATGKDAGITWRQLVQHTAGYGTSGRPGEAFQLSGEQAALMADTLVRDVFQSGWERVDEEVVEPLLTGPIQCQDRPSLAGDRPGLLAISPRDLARFGWLQLHEGRWGKRRLLDRRLAAMATSSPVSNRVPLASGEPGPMLPDQRRLGDWPGVDHRGSYSLGWWVNGVDRERRRLLPRAPTDTLVAIAEDGREGLVMVPQWELVLTFAGRKGVDDPFAAGGFLDAVLGELAASVR